MKPEVYIDGPEVDSTSRQTAKMVLQNSGRFKSEKDSGGDSFGGYVSCDMFRIFSGEIFIPVLKRTSQENEEIVCFKPPKLLQSLPFAFYQSGLMTSEYWGKGFEVGYV